MKLADLKERTQEYWSSTCIYEEVVIQKENFKGDIRKVFGDLRCKSTWERALCHYTARYHRLDGIGFPGLSLIHLFADLYEPWYSEYRDLLLESLLTLPNGAEYVLSHLQALDYNAETDDGIYGLVARAARERQLQIEASAGRNGAVAV